MTRINVGVDPSELNNQMLIAEHREIKRIPNCIKKGRYNLKGMPKEFTLNTGHVKFFYDKILFLKKRYQSLYNECKKRGFNVSDFSESFEDIPMSLMRDYQPTERDRQIILERIKSKLDRTFK